MAVPSRMSAEVAVIGEIYMDHVFSGFAGWPEPGEEIFTEDYTFELGGGAIATACALSRLGRSVQLVGVVGQSQLTLIMERLAPFQVSTDLLTETERGTGVTVSLSTAQDRSFFTYRGANCELETLLLNDAKMLDRAATTKHVHLAFPLSTQAAQRVLLRLRQHGATLSLDVGHHVEWLNNAANQPTLQQVDYFLPNQREAAILSGNAGNAEEYFAFCQSLGLRSAVLKLGAAGAAMRVDRTLYAARPWPTTVVDTTGAGDAFDAGFIDGLLERASPQACLDRACACGTLSTRAAGALGSLPDRPELERFLKQISEKSYGT